MKRIVDYLLLQRSISREEINKVLQIHEDMAKRGHYVSLLDLLLNKGVLTKVQLKLILRTLAIDELATCALFSGLTREKIASLVDNSEVVFFVYNELIYKQGIEANYVYLILEGTIGISYSLEQGGEPGLDNKQDGRRLLEEDICFLSKGEIFGDIDVLLNTNRLFNARTLSPGYVLKIPSHIFLQALDKYEDIKRQLILKWHTLLIKGWVNSQYLQDEYYQKLLQRGENIPCLPLLGRSKATKRYRDHIHELINLFDAILITGDPGTMKTRVAEYIGKLYVKDSDPILLFDRDLEFSFSGSFSFPIFHMFEKEIQQLIALFGYVDPGSSRSIWKGFIRLADKGTLIIKDVETLTPKVQKEIARYIRTKSFFPIGSDRPIFSNTKIIMTSYDELEIDTSLYALIKDNIIEVPPLKSRRKDVPYIVKKRIAQLNIELGKEVIEVEEKAMNKLVTYSWPGNYRELDNVIKRGMLLCNGPILTSEELFIGDTTPYESPVFNLFNFNAIKNFFKNPMFPRLGQIIMGLFLALAIFLGLFGKPSPQVNLSPILVWANWEPLLIISCFFVARMWCAICPVRYVGSWFEKIGLGLKFPKVFEKPSIIISGLLLIGIFFSQIYFSMYENPVATSVLLIVMLSLAGVISLLFTVTAWCKFLCPLGNMVGTFARLSVIELRANPNFCGVGCVSFECYKGTNLGDPCPMTKGPFTLTSNHECILCGNCVKSCPHESIQLNLRPPGLEQKRTKDIDLVLTVFVALLFATQIFRCIEPLIKIYDNAMNPLFLDLSLLTISFVCAIILIFIGAISLRFFNREDNPGKIFDLYFLNILLPITYAIEVGLRIVPIFYIAPRFFIVLGNFIKHNMPFIRFMLDLQSIFILQVLILLVGLWFSINILKSYLKHKKAASIYYYMIICQIISINGVFIFLFYLLSIKKIIL